MMLALGIESSCDDSAAALVRHDGARAEVLASVVAGQDALHRDFGGVVPEIAARAHAERLDGCVRAALAQAGATLGDIDGIAVTAGPGLIGGLLAGVMTARGLAAALGRPVWGVNHLAGHALTPRLTDGLAYPYLLLLVSGGHAQILIVHGPARFARLGGTIDDAPGEAFDKAARVLGLPQPGGPALEAAAAEAEALGAAPWPMPRPLLDRAGCDLSFSGLKTAVLRARDGAVAEDGGLRASVRARIAAGFQVAVADVLAQKVRRALDLYLAHDPPAPALAVAGGVAANRTVRARLMAVASEAGVAWAAPPSHLCTDNAAMIAFAALERHAHGIDPDAGLVARPRWPLDEEAAPMLGTGRRGAKA